MIRFLSNVPIFRRLFIIFVLATLLPGILILLLGNFYISSLDARGQAVRTSFDAQSLASQEETNLERMNALLQAKFYQIFASRSDVINDPSLFASGGLVDGEIRALEADFDQNLTLYQNSYDLSTSSNMSNIRSILLSDSPANGGDIIQDQQDAINSVVGEGKDWLTYRHYQDQELTQLESLQETLSTNFTAQQINASYQEDYDTLHLAIQSFTGLRNNWQQVVQAAVDMGKAVTSVGTSEVQPVFVATGVALFLTILVLLASFYIVDRTITRPLGQLALLTEHIAEGNTNARALIRGHDEIAKVANAMNNMLNNIVTLIQETQFQRDLLQAQVEKLVSEVSGVGEGDLSIQAEVTTDALGALADSFNYMVEELSSLVVRVKKMAHEVEGSTTLTFRNMIQLVESADRQIQQIGRATREVELMAGSTRQVADRSQFLYAIASEARKTAQAGRESVQHTIDGMDRIHTHVQSTAGKVQALGESSREIENIVGVIATIAHQTNRLALDAAVQAATAGENGRGFGVVASDIRRLSERVKEQASMIAHIVRSFSENISTAALSMQDTERETSVGANMAVETGLALESIFSVVERQGQEIEIINQMATHQLESSNMVTQIMQDVSISTQRSNQSTREAAQNMERLTLLAEQLLASVGAFKLRDQVDYLPSNAMLAANNEYGNLAKGREIYRTVTASATPQPVVQYAGNQQALPPGGLYEPVGARSGYLTQQRNGRGSSGLLHPDSGSLRPGSAPWNSTSGNLSRMGNSGTLRPGSTSGNLGNRAPNPDDGMQKSGSSPLNSTNNNLPRSGSGVLRAEEKQSRLRQNRLQRPPASTDKPQGS